MPKPQITIAIPTYRREEVLLDTIKGCLKQSLRNLEVIVVDQSLSHEPATQKGLTSITDPRFRYFVVDPASLTAARNFALAQAQAPIIIFIDDDVKLSKDFAKKHLEAYSKHPEISAVGGRVMQEGFPIKNDVLKFDEYAVSKGVFTSPKSGFTNAFAGGNCSMRVKDAQAIGGFDTRYYGNAFREESDMSLKLSNAGKKIWYEAEAELLHLAAPYGGLRVKGHIFDRAVFYRNELFFTLRWAARGKKFKALAKKYKEYCWVPSRRIRVKRTALFAQGLLAALSRFVWRKKIVAKIRP